MATLSSKDKIEYEELTRLRDFHLSEYKRFNSMILKKKTDSKLRLNESTEALRTYWKNKRIIDCNEVYSVLKAKKTETGTGELCLLLNEKMQYIVKKYDSMTFMNILGNVIKQDPRFYTYSDVVNGRRSTLYGLTEWNK